MTTTRDGAPTALGIFIFAGGFSVGVRDAGFRLLAHFDGTYGAETSRRNLGIKVHDDPAAWPWDEYAGVDFVYSNPPCAPWSSAGSKIVGERRDYSRGFDPRDDRVACVAAAFKGLERLRPKAWLWESVTRAFTAGRPLVDHYAERAMALGYDVSVVLHDGFDCGVPQHRKRFFFVAHRVPLPFERPDVEGPRTVGEVLDAMSSPGEDLQTHMWDVERECLAATPPGKKLRDAYMRIYGDSRRDPETGRYRGRPGFLYTRLDRAKHCPTLTGSPVFFHPDEDRKLTVQEMAALCGYPEGYEFVGTLGKKYAQVVQAVMPPVGRWIGGVVRRGVEEERPLRVREPRYRLVDYLKGDPASDYVSELKIETA